MVMISRTLAATAVLSVVGVGFTGIAHADPPLLNGTYSGADGDPTSLMVIATTCGPTGCTGSVASNKGWTVPATLTNGRRNFTVTKPDGVICADGRFGHAGRRDFRRLQLRLPGRHHQPDPVPVAEGRLSFPLPV